MTYAILLAWHLTLSWLLPQAAPEHLALWLAASHARPRVDSSCGSCALRGAHWSGRSLEFADLRGCDLRDADLSGSRLLGARLQGAVLDGADLRGADLRFADLSDASLRGADLRDADLSSAVIRDAATFEDARWQGAICPHEVLAEPDVGCAPDVSPLGG